MQQSAKRFADRLNQCLDDTGAPASERERAIILSKILDIPKQQAWALLEAQTFPDHPTLEKIATVFEVEPTWLSGEK